MQASFWNEWVWSLLLLLQSVSQEQRERKVTVDENPSGIYLYPEEESAVDNIFTPVSGRPTATMFEEAQKEVLRLMRIEVCFVFLFISHTADSCFWVASRPLQGTSGATESQWLESQWDSSHERKLLRVGAPEAPWSSLEVSRDGLGVCFGAQQQLDPVSLHTVHRVERKWNMRMTKTIWWIFQKRQKPHHEWALTCAVMAGSTTSLWLCHMSSPSLCSTFLSVNFQ